MTETLRRLKGLVAILAVALLLSACSDPIEVGLSGPPSQPTALIDPCRSATYDTVEWSDSVSGRVLWRIEFVKPTGQHAISYGKVPAGSHEVSRPKALMLERHVLVRFSTRDNDDQLAAGEFNLSGLRPDKVLVAHGSLETQALKPWLTCQS